jgi:hypothetical protein
MIDGNPSLDTDGDGKNDAIDNCRMISNADQANEDFDTFGDACDPCPPFDMFMQGTMMVDANADPDGDGVGNGCDPNPTVAGDRIRLFEGFTASLGTPMGAASMGSWTYTNGQAHVNASGGSVGTLYWLAPRTIDAARRDTIRTRLTISAVQSNNSVTGAGILAPMDPNLRGTGCFNGFNTSLRGLALGDSLPSGATTSLQFLDAPMIAMTTELKLARDANSTRTQCVAGNFMTPFASGMIMPNGNQVGLRAVSVNSDFDWFLWIDSPP